MNELVKDSKLTVNEYVDKKYIHPPNNPGIWRRQHLQENPVFAGKNQGFPYFFPQINLLRLEETPII